MEMRGRGSSCFPPWATGANTDSSAVPRPSVRAAGGFSSSPGEKGCRVFPLELEKDPNADDGTESSPRSQERGETGSALPPAPSTLAGAQQVKAGIKLPNPPEHFFHPNPDLQDPKGFFWAVTA